MLISKTIKAILYCLVSALLTFMMATIANSLDALMSLLTIPLVNIFFTFIATTLLLVCLFYQSAAYQPEQYLTLFLIGFWLIALPLIYVHEAQELIQEIWITFYILISNTLT